MYINVRNGRIQKNKEWPNNVKTNSDTTVISHKITDTPTKIYTTTTKTTKTANSTNITTNTTIRKK